MQKILIFSDLHGSLNALKSLMQTDDWKSADKRIFLGDIAIGFSRPNQCIDLLKKEDCICLLGNNDDYIANKIPQADYVEFLEDKLEHIEWMRQNVSDENKKWLASWQRDYMINWQSKKIYFTHYPWEMLDGEFSVIDSPKEKNLRARQQMFSKIDADYIFFGHEHIGNAFSDEKTIYFCLPTFGLANPAEYFMLYLTDSTIEVEKKDTVFDIDEEINLMFDAGYPYNKKKYKK